MNEIRDVAEGKLRETTKQKLTYLQLYIRVTICQVGILLRSRAVHWFACLRLGGPGKDWSNVTKKSDKDHTLLREMTQYRLHLEPDARLTEIGAQE